MPDEPRNPDFDREENWRLVNTPLGEAWSGRTRYAAAMAFYQAGEISADALEVYRLCARLDNQDPLSIIQDREADKDWLDRFKD